MTLTRLEELGVDALNVSSATYDAYNYWLETTSFKPGWRKYLAAEIKKNVSIPIIAANYIRSPEQAEQQLEEGIQDFVGSARNYICDPNWVNKTREGRENEIRRCIGCVNCMNTLVTDGATKNKPARCALNMALAHEIKYENLPKDGAGRKIVVVGAGPAGLTAAQTLAIRGFKVTVFEKNEKPGGQVITASSCNLKDKLYWAVEDLMTAVKSLDVDVRLGTQADMETIMEISPYAVIVAAGGTAVRPHSIPGMDGGNVYTAPQIIMKEKSIEKSDVVIIGSGITGLETAEILGKGKNNVIVIEMANTIAPGAWFQVVEDEFERIPKATTTFLTSTKVVEIKNGSVTVENICTKERYGIQADYVVLSMGVRPENAIVSQLKERGVRAYPVGDAVKSGTIADACHSAFDVASTLK